MATISVTPPVQEKSERIDKFIRRFEHAAVAYEWDDDKQAKLFPALVRDEKVLAQIENLTPEQMKSFTKMKAALVAFPREEVRKWIKEIRVDPTDPDTAVAELTKLVTMAYDGSTKQKIINWIIRDMFVDKLPDYLYKETIGKDDLRSIIETVKNKTVSAREMPKPTARPSSPTWAKANQREFAGQCFVCTKEGHMARDCPLRGQLKALHALNFDKDDRPRRKVNSEDGEMAGIIDTGARVTVFIHKDLDKVDAPMVVFGTANGSQLRTRGPVKKKFELENIMFEHEVYLASTDEALIGADFLRKYGAVISMGDDSIVFKSPPKVESTNKVMSNYAVAGSNKVVADNKDWMARKRQESNIKGIEYTKGDDNVVADALSLIEIGLIGASTTGTSSNLEELLAKDPNRFKRVDGRIWLTEKDSKRLCIESESEKKAILHELHNDNGHLGVYKTLEEVRRRFYWPNWSRDVKNHLKNCFNCAVKKEDIEPNKEELRVQESFEVFERVHVDMCGTLTESHGQKHFIVLQDAYSKWIEAASLPDTRTKTVADWLDNTVFTRFGHPETITTDNASYFESVEFKEFCAERGIKHHLATSYHHQGNGLAEKAIQLVEKMVRTSIEDQQDWSQPLAKCVASYNASKHHTTGVSPFSLMFNRQPRRQVDLRFKLDIPPLDEEWNRAIASVNTKKSQAKMKRYYDRDVRRCEFEENDTVLWHVMEQGPGKSKKLNRRWKGPYKIKEIHRPTAILSDKWGRTKQVHLNHVKLYRSRVPLAEFRFRGRPRI